MTTTTKINIAITIGMVVGVTTLLSSTAYAQVSRNGPVVTYTTPRLTAAAPAMDYANAKPMPLPLIHTAPPIGPSLATRVIPELIFGAPGLEDGNPGTAVGGQTHELAVQLAPAKAPVPQSDAEPSPEEYGTALQPYSTAQVNAFGDKTDTFYPYRATGKLFFNIGTAPFVCSASLIKRGVIVTAAHCVADYGKSTFYSGWQYVPSYNNGTAPYGVWTVSAVRIKTAYFNGTDNCAVYGVVCPDDVAVLVATPKNAVYPGAITGWYGYAWNYGYTPQGLSHITQLGYPQLLDQGVIMERNDAQGFIDPKSSNNTVIGSLMTGGSSGGPWIINFGLPPTLSPGISFGAGSGYNYVTHVTSWGFKDNPEIKQQGASPFTDQNIVVLVNFVCNATPAACA
jgi:Trypsin